MNWKFWTRWTRTRKLALALPVSDYQRFEFEAKSRGYASLGAWVQEVLYTNVPKPRQLAPPDESGRLNMEDAFKALDEDDRIADLSILGKHPDEAAPKAPPPKKAIPITGHPCSHLDPEVPAIARGSSCQGTCRAATQNGRPCNWAGIVASQCPYYVPRNRATFAAKMAKTLRLSK